VTKFIKVSLLYFALAGFSVVFASDVNVDDLFTPGGDEFLGGTSGTMDSSADADAVNAGKALGNSEILYWTDNPPVNGNSTLPATFDESQIVRKTRRWDDANSTWIIEEYVIDTSINTSGHGQAITPGGYSISLDQLKSAYDDQTGGSGIYLDSSASMAEDQLTMDGACLNPDPDMRPEECNNITSNAYGVFRRESALDRPDVSNEAWVDVSREIYRNAETFTQVFGDCSQSLNISSESTNFVYSKENRTCVRPLDYSGSCTGIHDISTKLFDQKYGSGQSTILGRVSIDNSKKYALNLVLGHDNPFPEHSAETCSQARTERITLQLHDPSAIKKATITYAIYDDIAEFKIDGSKLWESHSSSPSWASDLPEIEPPLPLISVPCSGDNTCSATKTETSHSPQLCENDRYYTRSKTVARERRDSRSGPSFSKKWGADGSCGVKSLASSGSPSPLCEAGYSMTGSSSGSYTCNKGVDENGDPVTEQVSITWYENYSCDIVDVYYNTSSSTGPDVYYEDYDSSKTTATINQDVTSYFTSKAPGELIDLEWTVKYGKIGGGMIVVNVEYDSGAVVQQDVWTPSNCVRAGIDVYSGWASGSATCDTDYAPYDFMGEICADIPMGTNHIRICESDLAETVFVDRADPIYDFCKSFAVDANYTYFLGEDEAVGDFTTTEEQCTQLENDPLCTKITTQCVDGARDITTDLCYVEEDVYECKFNPVAVPSSIDLTYQCNSSMACLDGSCSDTITDSADWDDFAEAAGMMAVKETIGDSTVCSDPNDPLTCRMFSGETKTCRQFLSDGLGGALGWDQKCCEKEFAAEQQVLSQFTQSIKDMLGVKASATAALALEDGNEFTGDSSFEHIQGNSATANYTYSDLSEYLVNMEDSVTGDVVSGDDPQETAYEATLGTKIDDGLTDLFGADYGPALESAGMVAVELGAEYVVKNYLANTAIGAIAGPLGWAMMVKDAGALLSSLFFHCEPEEMELWSQRKLGNCTYLGKKCSDCLSLGGDCDDVKWDSWSCTAYKEKYCCYGNMLGKLVQEGVRGNAQMGLEFGSYKSPDCEGLTIEQLARIDWTLVDFEPWVKFLLEHDIIPTDISMDLTGNDSEYAVAGVERLDAAQRAIARMTTVEERSNTEILESAEDTVDRNIDTSDPWFNDYDGVLCEYDFEGLAPVDRPMCQTWAHDNCEIIGYGSHVMCSWLNTWAASCDAQDLGVTLSSSCQDFRAGYCDMTMYATSVEACGVMGDVTLMAQVATCESENWLGQLSVGCQSTRADVCWHSYFYASSNLCRPFDTGPIYDQIDLCLSDPTDYSCLQLKNSIACDWTPWDLTVPVCEVTPWDSERQGVECEFDFLDNGWNPEDYAVCQSYAKGACSQVDHFPHYMCEYVDAQMGVCDSFDTTVTLSSSCQSAAIEYCSMSRYATNEVCGVLGDPGLMATASYCESAPFTDFVGTACQDAAVAVCGHGLFLTSDLCNPINGGPAYDRAVSCDTTDLTTLTTANCLEFTSSTACTWEPWKSSNPACSNPYVSVTTEECTPIHSISSKGAGGKYTWDNGSTQLQNQSVYWGPGSVELNRDACVTYSIRNHSMKYMSTSNIDNTGGNTGTNRKAYKDQLYQLEVNMYGSDHVILGPMRYRRYYAQQTGDDGAIGAGLVRDGTWRRRRCHFYINIWEQYSDHTGTYRSDVTVNHGSTTIGYENHNWRTWQFNETCDTSKATMDWADIPWP